MIPLIWMLFGVITSVAASTRGRSGFGWFLLGILLGPFGFALVLVMPNLSKNGKQVKAPVILSPEVRKALQSAEQSLFSGNLDTALSDLRRVVLLKPDAPNSLFRMACIFSLKKNAEESLSHLARAVEAGFDDFPKIQSVAELSFLREQTSFQNFAENGYRLTRAQGFPDRISQLERLAKLKENGAITEEEFAIEKKKLLAG